MIFSRIVYASILIGIAAGLLSSCLQLTSLNPIIVTAERYLVEAGAAPGPIADEHSGHSHEHETWIPAAGFERTAYTFLANVLASTGFAAIMLALMCLFGLARRRYISWSQGALWGLAAYAALFLAPAIGMPPEIPGSVSGPVEFRQLWWILTAVSVAAGFGLFAFARDGFKLTGLPLLALPYVIGAPRPDGSEAAPSSPATAEALVHLQQQFVVTSAITNLVFWLLLGLACRYAFTRWLSNVATSQGQVHS